MSMVSFFIRFFAVVTVLVLAVSWYFIPDDVFVEYGEGVMQEPVIVSEIDLSNDAASSDPLADALQNEGEGEKDGVSDKKEHQEKKRVEHSVAFIVQAPRAQWDDPRFQDACEEASMIMAHAWVTEERSVSKEDAEEQMETLFVAENKMFGDVIDTSAVDTAQFFTSHFGHRADVKMGVKMEDLYDIVAQGNIIIAPTNGKALNNPNFTDGGPERHMLVIIGFDRENKEFITNDPGTRLGRGYKYKDSVLYNAIRDYPTGHKEAIQGAQKNVIVISK